MKASIKRATGAIRPAMDRCRFGSGDARETGKAHRAAQAGKARATRDGHVVNVLAYRGRCEPEHLRPLFVDGAFRVLAEYALCPAVAAPAPGQTPLPMEWGDGLFLAGDCTGLFPSQEAAVSSGEAVARQLHHD